MKNMTDVELDGIDYRDYPDFCNAFICSATWKDSLKELTDNELDQLNDERDFVYDCVINHIF